MPYYYTRWLLQPINFRNHNFRNLIFLFICFYVNRFPGLDLFGESHLIPHCRLLEISSYIVELELLFRSYIKSFSLSRIVSNRQFSCIPYSYKYFILYLQVFCFFFYYLLSRENTAVWFECKPLLLLATEHLVSTRL